MERPSPWQKEITMHARDPTAVPFSPPTADAQRHPNENKRKTKVMTAIEMAQFMTW